MNTDPAVARVATVRPSDDDPSTEARLLREAARLFRKQGYTRTSTRELAAVMGLKSASLYHYMKTKEDLLSAICLQGYDLLHTAVTDAVTDLDNPLQALEAAIHAHLRTAIAHRDIYLTILTEVRFLSTRQRREVNRQGEAYADLLVTLLEHARTADELRPDIPVDHLKLVLRNLLSWTLFWYRTDGDLTIDQIADLMYTVFLTGARPQDSDTAGARSGPTAVRSARPHRVPTRGARA